MTQRFLIERRQVCTGSSRARTQSRSLSLSLSLVLSHAHTFSVAFSLTVLTSADSRQLAAAPVLYKKMSSRRTKMTRCEKSRLACFGLSVKLHRSLSRNARWELEYGKRRYGFNTKHQSIKACGQTPASLRTEKSCALSTSSNSLQLLRRPGKSRSASKLQHTQGHLPNLATV